MRVPVRALLLGCIIVFAACNGDNASAPIASDTSATRTNLPPGWTTWPLGGPVSALAPGPDGTAWAVVGGALWHFDGTDWAVRDGQPPGELTALASAPDGTLWVGTSEGVAELDGDTWRQWGSAEGLPFDRVFALAVDRAGVPWASTAEYVVPEDDSARALPGGVSRFDGTTWETLGPEVGIPTLRSDAVATFPEPTEGGVAYVVASLAASSDGMWIGTLIGSCLFAGDTCGAPGVPVSAVAPGVWPAGIASDPDGGAVFAPVPTTSTGAAGAAPGMQLVVFDGIRWSTVEGAPMTSTVFEQTPLPAPAAGWGPAIYEITGSSATLDPLTPAAGSLWVHDGSGWAELRSPDGFVAGNATRVVVADDGVVWVGTSAGMARFVPEGGDASDGPPTSPSPGTAAEYADAFGRSLQTDRDELGLSEEQVGCLAESMVETLDPTWLDASEVTPYRVLPLDETFMQESTAYLATDLTSTASGRLLRSTVVLSEPTAQAFVAGIDECVPLADLWVRAFTKDSGFGANRARCLQEQLDTALVTDLLVLGLTTSEQGRMLQQADPATSPSESVQRFQNDLPRLAEACDIEPDLLRYFFS